MATLADFDFFNRAVQSGHTEGQYVNAESILIAMGPPSLASMSLAQPSLESALNQGVAFPLGLVQQFSMGQNLAWQRIFEIGSKRSLFIPGRPVGTIGMGRAWYHGPSLLRAAMAYYSSPAGGGGIEIPGLYNTGQVMQRVNPHTVRIAPGSGVNGNLYINLASDLFTQPLGMLLLFRDSNEQTIGAVYVEYCVIPTHGITFDSQSLVVQEQMSLLFERLVPIDVSQIVPLVGTPDNPYGIIGAPVNLNA